MQISNQEMDECIEEEMSQDMEKGFCVLGTSSCFYCFKIRIIDFKSWIYYFLTF